VIKTVKPIFKVVILLLLVVRVAAAQQHFVFTPISTTNGLANNEVRNITQLKDGRMVVVTNGIINIYNGTTFEYVHTNEQYYYPLSGYTGSLRSYVENNDRLWLKSQGKLILINYNNRSFENRADSVLKAMGANEPLANFFIDAKHNAWLLTSSDKLLYRNYKTGKVNTFCTRVSNINGEKDVLYDIAVVNNQLYLYYKSGMFTCYNMLTRKVITRGNSLTTADQEKYNTTLFSAQNGNNLYQLRNGKGGGILLWYNLRQQRWQKLLEVKYALSHLSITRNGNLLLSCPEGLWYINRKNLEKQQIKNLQIVDGSSFNTEVSTLYYDNQEGLWVGTLNHGLLYFHPDKFKLRNLGRAFFPSGNGEDISISCFSEKTNGDILVGTYNGLFIYPKNAEKLTTYSPAISNVHCNALVKDRLNRTWLCATTGLYCITEKQVQHFPLGNIMNVFFDEDNTIYLQTDNRGFGIFDPNNGGYRRLAADEQKAAKVNQMVYWKGLLIGINNTGLFTYDVKKGTVNFPNQKGNNVPKMFKHSNHNYKTIYVDSRRLLCFGTQDGLNIWDDSNQKLYTFNTTDGLVNNSVKGIIEDSQHTLWVSTSGGVSRLHIRNGKEKRAFSFSNFNTYDGVIKEEFIRRSIFISNNNHLFIGGINGFNEIDLGRFSIKPTKLFPLFTSFQLFGQEVKEDVPYNGNNILSRDISSTKKIVLNHDQNFFTIGFTGLNYVNPTQTYYRYILEGVDDDWHEISTDDGIGRTTYTDLSPGSYTFKVRAADNNANWNGPIVKMDITVKAPFWRTPFAIIFYVTLFFAALYLSLKIYLRQSSLAIIRTQQQKLDTMKINFLSNMGHELRTPLTLILTPLEAIIKKMNDAALRGQLENIHHNAFNMLNMVNNLLDFRHNEFKGETLNLDYVNIADILQPITESFKELAKERQIIFAPDCCMKEHFLYLDKDKVAKMANNLLSNAIKFTQAGGTIQLKVFVDDTDLVIKVVDNGLGLKETEVQKIFDRYYQADNQRNGIKGNGIGLNLVKEYIELHNGRIDVESKINNGSIFSIAIPLNLKPPNHDTKPLIEFSNSDTRPTVLIAEDNNTFREFLAEQLTSTYNVLTAVDGSDGLTKVIENLPDLVISDVTMPNLNGIELCKAIKSDVRISHTPVILLTARYTDNVQLNAYDAGADAYISKPFNLDILLSRARNLIEQHQKRLQVFKNAIVIQAEEVTTTSFDQELIEKALKFIDENLHNSSYSVEQLSKDMNMDRTGLYRKLVALTGQAPTMFIRSVRLKKAVVYLKQQRYSQAEIAEKVGFSTAAYFSKCFKEEYGVSPSNY
jgi:signal transduction histidine kinase/DNA-binding response OmpR family regulator/ligand-binding sensor domain-containing protein